MMCERCGKRPATTYVKRTINGQTTEWHLCAECAAAEGVGLFGGFGFGVGDLFGGFLTQPALRDLRQKLSGYRRERAGRLPRLLYDFL